MQKKTCVLVTSAGASHTTSKAVGRKSVCRPGGMRVLAGIQSRLLFMLLLIAPSLSEAGIRWDDPWRVSANGQELSVETFESPNTVDLVVQELVRANNAYQRYLVADGRILLSGVDGGAHWLAEVRGHAQGAQGYVSALYFDAGRAEAPTFAALRPRATQAQPASPSQAGHPPGQVFEFDASARVALIPQAGGSAMRLAVSVPEQ